MIEIGQRFGKWTVIGEATRRETHRYSLCQCDCGIIREVGNSQLKNGKSRGCKSCKNNMYQPRILDGKRRLQIIRNKCLTSAKVRNIPYDLSDSLLEELSNLPCHYCGAPPANYINRQNFHAVYQGLDRKDSSRGYIPDNVVPCCIICNQAKMGISYHDFMEWIKGLVRYQIAKDLGD